MTQTLHGLRALLINMPIRESVLPNTAPMAVTLLAAILQKGGAEVSIIDLNAYRYPDGKGGLRWMNESELDILLQNHISENDIPSFVGFSGMITTLAWQERTARAIRQLLPSAYIASGGGLATTFWHDLRKLIPEIDGICVGEGEGPIVEMADSVKAGNRSRGLWRGGKVALDSLPLPAWDLLKKDAIGAPVLDEYLSRPIWGPGTGNLNGWGPKSTRSLNTVSSRGCPFACSFCFHDSTGGRVYNMRSAESMAAEIGQYADDYAIDFLGILDDNFLANPSRIELLPDTVGKVCNEKGVTWGTHARLDNADPKSLHSMKAAGCVYIGYGAETASPKMVSAMNKGGGILSSGTRNLNGYDVPETMASGYENTIRAGLYANCTWILGFPGETLNDLKHSVAFMKWQKEISQSDRPPNTKIFTATAFPGTKMFSHPTVRARLETGFRIKYDADGKPIVNEALRDYVLRLDDAEKVLTDLNGDQIYYGDMPLETFQKARELIDANQTEEILAL